MWVFTKDGFFAVAENKNDKNTVIVRARLREDMDRLVSNVVDWDIEWTTPPWRDEEADYPERGIMSKEDWGLYLMRSAEDIDYPSLKAHVLTFDGQDRYSRMTEIWHAITRLETWRGRTRDRLKRMGVR